jgi:hypothetical protein
LTELHHAPVAFGLIVGRAVNSRCILRAHSSFSISKKSNFPFSLKKVLHSKKESHFLTENIKFPSFNESF